MMALRRSDAPEDHHRAGGGPGADTSWERGRDTRAPRRRPRVLRGGVCKMHRPRDAPMDRPGRRVTKRAVMRGGAVIVVLSPWCRRMASPHGGLGRSLKNPIHIIIARIG